MGKTAQTIIAGIFGIATLAIVLSPNGANGIKAFFGGLTSALSTAEKPIYG